MCPPIYLRKGKGIYFDKDIYITADCVKSDILDLTQTLILIT